MPSRDSSILCPTLQVFWPKLRAWYVAKFPDRQVFITCSYRSVEEQQALFKQNAPGRILTRCDGVIKKSKHNILPAHAFDVAVSEGGKVKWEPIYYVPLGRAIAELGYADRIRWGGWFSFRDYPHFEMVWPANEGPYSRLTDT